MPINLEINKTVTSLIYLSTGCTPLDPATGEPAPAPDYMTPAEARAELELLGEFDELFEVLGLDRLNTTRS